MTVHVTLDNTLLCDLRRRNTSLVRGKLNFAQTYERRYVHNYDTFMGCTMSVLGSTRDAVARIPFGCGARAAEILIVTGTRKAGVRDFGVMWYSSQRHLQAQLQMVHIAARYYLQPGKVSRSSFQIVTSGVNSN